MINSVRGTRGMAAAPHALASQSALAVLREGGNAIEAMVAAAATIAVVYPHMNSIGGDAFWLIRAPGQPVRGLDACGAAAGAASRDWYRARGIERSIPFRGGVAANTVAGTVSGWGAALELARAGLADFYRGDVARSLADGLARAGSPLSLADLQAHQAAWREPLSLRHSLGTLYNMPPPTQGLVSLAILGILDRIGIAAMDPEGADFVHAAVEATKQAFAVRDRHVTDPARMRVDPTELLADAELARMRAAIDPAKAAPWGAGRGPGDTIWMGVVDGAGCAVSFIQSVYHEFGSGLVLADTGVAWQNRGCSFSLDPAALNCLEPGRKPFHTLNPAMALLDDGRTIVYGNMGGDGQPQSQSAVFARIAVFGMEPQAAITAPRWLLGRTWGRPSETLKLESRFPAQTFDELRRRGHDVEAVQPFDEAMGHAQAIVARAGGVLEGGADPRGDGVVAAF